MRGGVIFFLIILCSRLNVFAESAACKRCTAHSVNPGNFVKSDTSEFWQHLTLHFFQITRSLLVFKNFNILNYTVFDGNFGGNVAVVAAMPSEEFLSAPT